MEERQGRKRPILTDAAACLSRPCPGSRQRVLAKCPSKGFFMITNVSRSARFAAVATAFAGLLLGGILGPFAAARAATAHLVVSLTFDDSTEDQYTNALPALESHGMVGTFYAISGYIGVDSGYMTLPQLQAI